MKKLTLILAVLTILSAQLTAQNHCPPYQETADKYRVETNRFANNWFLGVNAGAQLFMGENDTQLKFGKRLAPTVEIQVGKWFTPALGIRTQFDWAKLKDGRLNSYYEPYSHSGNFYDLHLDVMLNLMDLFGGYKANRCYSLIPYVGFGWVQGNSNNEIGAFAGLINQFRLGKRWNMNAEFKLRGFSGSMDDIHQGIDGTAGLTLGFSYKFPSRTFTPVSHRMNQAEISQLQQALCQAREENQRLTKHNARLRERAYHVPEEVIITEPVLDFPPFTVFFQINEWQLRSQELINLQAFAEKINAYPTHRFMLTGYADSQTGSRAYNETISRKRVEAVYHYLVDTYHVHPDRLIVTYLGGVPQLFKEDSQLSRAVVIKMIK